MSSVRTLLRLGLFVGVSTFSLELSAQTPAGSEKVAPKPRAGGEGPASPAEKKSRVDLDLLDARIRKIEDSLLDELGNLERRIQVLKDRLRPNDASLQSRPAPLAPGLQPEVKLPPELNPAEDAALEDRQKRLLKRQEELVSRWLELDRPRASASNGDEEAERKRVRQAAEVESELRGVLGEMLELRESARERQIARLRQELDSLERALGARRSREDREKAVQARLKELLGRKDPPSERK